MRDHSKVMASFWTGKTGRALRGDKDAQILGLFLLTCRHANMAGLYELPLSYAAQETGLTIEEVASAMARLSAPGVDFAHYDHAMEFVWVVNMAPIQLDLKPGKAMSPADKRHGALARQVDVARRSTLYARFLKAYSKRLSLDELTSTDLQEEGASKGLPSVNDAPSEGHPASPRGAGAGAGAGAGGEGLAAPAPAAPPLPAFDVMSWNLARGEVCHQRKITAPTGTRDQDRRTVERVRDMARTHGVAPAEAARRLTDACLDACNGARDGLKQFPFLALTLDPYAPSSPPGGAAKAIHEPTPKAKVLPW